MADGIPVYFTPFRIVPAEDSTRGVTGHKAVWLRRTARDTMTALDASPVLPGGSDRVRTFMAFVYADVREVKGGRMTES